jgi:NitT/TauT family transport system permease protein
MTVTSAVARNWRLFRKAPLAYTRTRPEVVLAPSLFVVIMVTWQFVTSYFDVAVFVLPPPSRILRSLVQGLSFGVTNPRGYLYHASITVAEAVSGFLIGSVSGIVIGTLVAHSRIVERTLYPYIIALQSLPKVAVAPLFVIWFGFGMMPKIVVTAIITFFPLLVNSIAGFESVERERVDLVRSLGASQWQIFTKIEFPSALPFIFAGLDMAIVLSWLGAIIGEFVGAQRGLGVLILQMNFNMNIPGVYSVFVILSLLGVSGHLLMRALERRFVFWAAPDVRSMGA